MFCAIVVPYRVDRMILLLSATLMKINYFKAVYLEMTSAFILRSKPNEIIQVSSEGLKSCYMAVYSIFIDPRTAAKVRIKLVCVKL